MQFLFVPHLSKVNYINMIRPVCEITVIGVESATGYYLTSSGIKNVLLLEQVRLHIKRNNNNFIYLFFMHFIVSQFSRQFDALHTCGSSHGGSRIMLINNLTMWKWWKCLLDCGQKKNNCLERNFISEWVISKHNPSSSIGKLGICS